MSAAEEHRTAYEVLGVPRDATTEEIRRAYRRAARAAHPDVGGDPAAFRAVTRAWDLLGDAEATSCTMTDTDGDVYDMHSFAGINNYYTATDLPAGTYRIDCEGLPAGAAIAGMDVSGGDITKSSTNGLIWSTVVGVSGTIIMIIGIVLVVKANGRRREIRQQAMMSAIG